MPFSSARLPDIGASRFFHFFYSVNGGLTVFFFRAFIIFYLIEPLWSVLTVLTHIHHLSLFFFLHLRPRPPPLSLSCSLLLLFPAFFLFFHLFSHFSSAHELIHVFPCSSDSHNSHQSDPANYFTCIHYIFIF